MSLIGLAGVARSGKDTVANFLVEHHGFTRMAFADAVREMLYRVDPLIEIPIDDETLYIGRVAEYVDGFGWEAAKALPEVRRLLQRLGTDAGRAVLGEDVWVDALFGSARIGRLVISDCRFANEVKAIRQEGGFVLRVERPGVGPVNAHVSERALGDFTPDETIHNDGTLEDLHEEVERVMESLGVL